MLFKYWGPAWFLPSVVLGVLAAVVLSILVGLLIIRVSGVFFTVMTLAFGQLAWQITFRWYGFTGGDDGIQGIIPEGILGNRIFYYYFTLVLVALSIVFLKAPCRVPHGAHAEVRSTDPDRVRFLGQSVKRNQLTIYMISSAFSALAGSLMAGVDNSIHPNMLYWTTSGEVILMSVLGGIGQFFGPFIGAAVLIVVEDKVPRADGVLAAHRRNHHDGDGPAVSQRSRRRTAAVGGPFPGNRAGCKRLRWNPCWCSKTLTNPSAD